MMRYGILTLVLLLVPAAQAIDHPAAATSKQAAKKQDTKSADAEARISKKESRMSERDKEIDRRMKQQKSFKK